MRHVALSNDHTFLTSRLTPYPLNPKAGVPAHVHVHPAVQEQDQRPLGRSRPDPPPCPRLPCISSLSPSRSCALSLAPSPPPPPPSVGLPPLCQATEVNKRCVNKREFGLGGAEVPPRCPAARSRWCSSARSRRESRCGRRSTSWPEMARARCPGGIVTTGDT